VGEAALRFYAELKDFLRPDLRGGSAIFGFQRETTVKHAIESLGVPHTEVDLILVNGENSDFSRILRDGDRVSVYPVFESIDISSITRVRPEPLRELRFVLDCHLGRLAKYLRLPGFDALYSRFGEDAELADVSHREKRVLLTMDRDLLKRSKVERGYLVHDANPRDQLTEVLRRFDLKESFKPFVRCLECNARLETVSKQAVLERVPERVAEWCEEFQRCTGCGRVFWKGSHYERMRGMVEELIGAG
jgi:uncharacterized protein with PIN domain